MQTITVTTTINKPLGEVWNAFTFPSHINEWCHAGDDWAAKDAVNDVTVGGRFSTTMYAKDNSASFDFSGTYTEVIKNTKLAYLMDGDDARTVQIFFEAIDERVTQVTEIFDPEEENSEELQRAGWQSILDNFKKYVEEVGGN